MRERPILFNAPMVRAILEGRKTQTRRVCRDQTPSKYWFGEKLPMVPDGKDRYTGWVKDIKGVAIGIPTQSPYGQPGDRLWVREDIEANNYFDYFYVADNSLVEPKTEFGDWEGVELPYDSEYVGIVEAKYIPKELSRITLEITGVRVERVQEVTEKDAKAEGCGDFHPWYPSFEFEALWDSINANRGFGWDLNPWVWVIEFRRVS